MDSQHDIELHRWLDGYQVAPADDALLERIVAAAQAQKIMPLRVAANSNVAWLKNAALLTATALVGLWIGSVSLPAGTTDYASADTAATGQTINIDHVVLGPKSLEEIML